METVTIPVMAKCRIGHFAEAQILQSLGVDFIDESEGTCMRESVVRDFHVVLVNASKALLV